MTTRSARLVARLSHEKANKLVALFHNLRLLKRMKTPNYTEPMIAWGDTDEVDVERSRVTKYELGQAGPSKLLQAQAGPSKLLLKPQKTEVLPLLPIS